jgi:quercetin dioxygenase-like cupin family protein
MKFVVTGVGENGRSRVVESHEVHQDRAQRMGSLLSEVLWSTNEIPFETPGPGRKPNEPVLDFGIPPGATRFTMLRIESGEEEHGLHRTDTIDYDVVLEGQVTLLLEDELVNLERCDSVVLPGTVHGWRAGPDGVLLSIVVLGLPAPQ